MRLSELQEKDIINILDGKKIGNIVDIKVSENGAIDSLVVEKTKFLVSRFTSSNEIEIKWQQIEKVGKDVILVNINEKN